MEKYDRLYLIGNGFDLHHDMKTKYSDYADGCMRITAIYIGAYSVFMILMLMTCGELSKSL